MYEDAFVKLVNILQSRIANILQVNISLGIDKYMGLPSMIQRNKKDLFKFIKDRIWKKLNFWGGISLLKVGIEVMIKPVLQCIPTFMIIFLVPSLTRT